MMRPWRRSWIASRRDAAALAADPPARGRAYTITLGPRTACVTPMTARQARAEGGIIDVSTPSPNVLAMAMSGVGGRQRLPRPHLDGDRDLPPRVRNSRSTAPTPPRLRPADPGKLPGRLRPRRSTRRAACVEARLGQGLRRPAARTPAGRRRTRRCASRATTAGSATSTCRRSGSTGCRWAGTPGRRLRPDLPTPAACTTATPPPTSRRAPPLPADWVRTRDPFQGVDKKDFGFSVNLSAASVGSTPSPASGATPLSRSLPIGDGPCFPGSSRPLPRPCSGPSRSRGCARPRRR